MISNLLSRLQSKTIINLLWQLADKIGSLGISFIVGIFVARYLGPGEFGLLGYAQSLSVFFAVIAGMGVNGILQRNIINDKDRLGTVLGTALVLRLWGSLISLVVFGFFALIAGETRESFYLTLIIMVGTIFQSFNIIEIYFNCNYKSRLPTIVKLVQSIFNNAIRVYLIVTHAPLMWFAWSLLLNEAINAVGMILIYRKQPIAFSRWSASMDYAKEMLRDSWPLILSGFVFIFYSRIDQVMIKHMLGNEEVGVYSVAVRFSDLWAFLPGTIGAALYPSILNARKSGTALYLKKMQQLFDVMLWVCIGVIIPATYLLGDWAISSWYGPEYAEAADVLKIYVISGIFAYTGTALYYWLLTENKQRYGLIRAMIGAVINVLLNWLFIPVWGIKGAAFATLISEFFGSYISSLLTKSTFPAFKMQTKTIFLYSTFLQVAELGRRLGRRRLRWISLVLK